jgi:hypothetical protein
MNDQLDRYLNRQLLFTQGVRDDFPNIWNIAGEAIERSNNLMHRVYEDRDDAGLQDLFGLWGEIRRYQISSLLQIFARNLDQGLAILRMATELVRLLKVASCDPTVREHWFTMSSSALDHCRHIRACYPRPGR